MTLTQQIKASGHHMHAQVIKHAHHQLMFTSLYFIFRKNKKRTRGVRSSELSQLAVFRAKYYGYNESLKIVFCVLVFNKVC